jgi:carbon storage regulator
MLVLTRKLDQSIMIGKEIEITILEVRGEQVRLGIRAPHQVAVHRKEVFEQIGSDFDSSTSRNHTQTPEYTESVAAKLVAAK